MSPSESDLRAALRQGDDSGLSVNANSIIAQGQAIRARRVRILSGAAAVIVVAGGAVGIALARGDGGGGSNLAGGGSADVRANGATPVAPKEGRREPASPLPSAAASTASGAVVPRPAAGGTALYAAQCPDSPPHLLTPGGGSAQFGVDDPLFSQPVDTLVVCVFGTTPSTAAGVPGRLTFTGREATQIVTSMEQDTGKPSSTPCDAGPPTSGKLLEFIGITSGGKSLPPVTATVNTPACNVQLTNGTAVRYDWSPPAVLTGQLTGLTPPRTVITVPGEPTVIGSPIHS